MPHALVIGAGISGTGAARFLRKNGFAVTIADRCSIPIALQKALSQHGVRICSETENIRLLVDCDLVVIGPTVTRNNPLFQGAAERGIPITTEVDLACESFHGAVIGVTGTNGKSTVTAMIAHGLGHLRFNAQACGNIGIPPTELLLDAPPEVLVIELSSYQLEYSTKVTPEVSIFTSFSHDHLGRHFTMERYFSAKWRLIQATKASGLVVMPSEVWRYTAAYPSFGMRAEHIIVDQPQAGLERFPEWHNRLNGSMAALAISKVAEVPLESALASIQAFKFLPYRCQYLGKLSGFDVINDSKSTNVEATLMALRSQITPVILMMGGQGKGESYIPIVMFQPLIKELVLFGASRNEILRDVDGKMKTVVFRRLDEAIAYVKSKDAAKAAILFSPGCASFDEFRNFEQRGEFFTEKIGARPP